MSSYAAAATERWGYEHHSIADVAIVLGRSDDNPEINVPGDVSAILEPLQRGKPRRFKGGAFARWLRGQDLNL